MAAINGLSNNPPYSSDLPVNVSVDGNGTVRLCVSQGIPKEGEVTNFKNIYAVGNGSGSQSIYTAPQGKTFYIMGILYMATASGIQVATHWQIQDGNGNIVQQADILLTSNGLSNGINGMPPALSQFPIGIVQQGQSIVLKAIGAFNSTDFSINFIGYEEWGQTN